MTFRKYDETEVVQNLATEEKKGELEIEIDIIEAPENEGDRSFGVDSINDRHRISPTEPIAVVQLEKILMNQLMRRGAEIVRRGLNF